MGRIRNARLDLIKQSGRCAQLEKLERDKCASFVSSALFDKSTAEWAKQSLGHLVFSVVNCQSEDEKHHLLEMGRRQLRVYDQSVASERKCQAYAGGTSEGRPVLHAEAGLCRRSEPALAPLHAGSAGRESPAARRERRPQSKRSTRNAVRGARRSGRKPQRQREAAAVEDRQTAGRIHGVTPSASPTDSVAPTVSLARNPPLDFNPDLALTLNLGARVPPYHRRSGFSLTCFLPGNQSESGCSLTYTVPPL